MSATDWLSLVTVCLLGALLPGPSLMVILACVTQSGRISGILAAVGHGLGVFVYALVAASGLSYMLNHQQAVFVWLQLLGAGLLFWLGVRTLRSVINPAGNSFTTAPPAVLKSAFRDGFLIAVFNPKIAVFFASLFSQYLSDGQSFLLHLSMAGLAGFIDLAVFVFYAVLASTTVVHGLMSRYAWIRDVLFATVLIGLAVSLFVSHLGWI